MNKWRKQTRTLALHHRRARVQNIIDTATLYWANNNTHYYLKTFNNLTPKAYAQKPHLRGSHGQLLSPEEELQELDSYMKTL